MMKRKQLLSVIAWITLIGIVALSAAGCGADPAVTDYSEQIAQLEQDYAALQSQIDGLSARLEALESTGLKGWSLTAAAWSSSNGATVTLTAEPAAFQEGQTAALSVRLNGLEAENVPCTWDGTAYTATVDLNAADGYSYYCILTAPDGAREQIALNTPENPVDDTLVYLETSLSSYCNMFVEDWEAEDGKLAVTSGYIQVQTPRISTDGKAAAYTRAELCFQLNGQEIDRQAITLPEGEGGGSYELALTGISFPIPELEDDYQLDLWLEVTLSNGETITCNGGSWYYFGGELNLIVG